MQQLYSLTHITPITQITAQDRKALGIACDIALKSDFKTFRLGACVKHSKVYV